VVASRRAIASAAIRGRGDGRTGNCYPPNKPGKIVLRIINNVRTVVPNWCVGHEKELIGLA